MRHRCNPMRSRLRQLPAAHRHSACVLSRRAASKTLWQAGADPAPVIGRFNRITGSTWEEETNSKQARATKPSPRVTAWERPGGQVNERVVIEENACNAEILVPREVACGGT